MANNAQRRIRRKMKKLRPKKKRPKTFKTEESAKSYADKEGIKKYKIVNIRLLDSQPAKYKVVAE